MNAPRRVAIHAAAREAFGTPAVLPIGAVFVSDAGLALRVRDDGGLDPVQLLGWRSIASDPTATVRP